MIRVILILSSVLAGLLSFSLSSWAQVVCSPAVTNQACAITIDRESPSSPLGVKVQPGAVVTLHVTKRPLDKVTFDATISEVQTPDPLSAILAAFSPSLKTITFNTGVSGGGRIVTLNDPSISGLAAGPGNNMLKRLNRIDIQQRAVVPLLESVKTLTDQAGKDLGSFQAIKVSEWATHDLGGDRDDLVKSMTTASTTKPPRGVVDGLHEALIEVEKDYAMLSAASPAPTPAEMDEIGKALNDVAANQATLDASLASVQAAQTGVITAVAALRKIEPSKSLFVEQPYGGSTSGVGRTATVKVSVQDVLTNTPTSLGTVTVTWSSTRWEVSTGAVFSFLPNRSFQASPQIVKGQVILDSSGKTNTLITESITRPSIIPFALAHYRVNEWSHGDRRSAFLISGGLGVSPYSGSADFAGGLTLSYRSAMLSGLVHYGRDVRLTNGLYLGQPLGSSPPALSTERYWVGKVGIALTVRVF